MKRKRGFTLIEAMIVIAIIMILAGIMGPQLIKVQLRKVKESATLSNLSNLRSAISMYFAENDGLFPYRLDDKEYNIEGRYYPPFIPRYIKKIPYATIPTENDSNTIYYTTNPNQKSHCDKGGWLYNPVTGIIRINCGCYNLAGTKRYCDY